MIALSSVSSLSRSYNFFCFPSLNLTKFSLFSFSSAASPANTSNSDPFIVDYLIETFGFSKTQAFSLSKRFRNAKGPEKPDSVLHLLRHLGFSETHIRGAVRVTPQILFADVEKTLKPKLGLFQQLGLTGFELGHFVSKNATLLTVSLDRKLIPCIEILKKILSVGGDHRDLIRVLQRCNWIISKDPESRLLPNISFLQSCGIIGSQLAMLLKRQPGLFVKRESNLRDLVRKVEEMGFSADSRMLVHALYTLNCISPETLRRKFKLLWSFGFSEGECMAMFRRTPGLLRTSEEKLRLGIEFLMNTVGIERTALVHQPACLMHSVEKRIIPRYRVLGILKSKRLLKKDPSFINLVHLSEEEFLEKYISRFGYNAEELLVAYMGDVSDSSEE